MRRLLLGIWIMILLTGICYLFWHEDWKYSLPTPVPKNYNPVEIGAVVNINHKVRSDNRPSFVHFFNPDCPCSRFNIPHFRSLVRKYGDKINFAVVVMHKDAKYSEDKIRDKFELDIPVYFDQSIANTCGVYSTPQAVLIGADQKLYYRGNYNKSRFCSDKNTNFAQMAIDSLLGNHSAFKPGQAALKSYGCSLPYCTK
jgi:hypothetical protein